MSVNSLPPAPVPGQPVGAAEPFGECEQPWGRGTGDLAVVSDAVTPDLPSVERSPLTGYPAQTTEDDEAARARALLLQRLREIGDWPPPAGPARRAQPDELPAPALALRTAAVEPWTTSCWYAPAGSVPYTFERKRGGYLMTAVAYVRLGHPDGRRAVAVWVCDSLAQRGRAGAKTWGLCWSYDEGWRWRGGPNGTYPVRIGALALRAAVADPTWRANPYRLEEAA